MASVLATALPSAWPHYNKARRSPPRLQSQTRPHRRSHSPIDLNNNSSHFAEIPLLPVSATSSSPRHRLHAQSKGDYSLTHSSSPGDAGAAEAFYWPAVVLPFLFPALGGLLFGYDIGATSGAAISLQSAELSGTNWFNLSAVQLGLVVSGSLYGALAGSLIAYPTADFLEEEESLL